MNLSKHSKDRLLATLNEWRVDKDFADPMYNYLVYGFSPGSCFTAVLANDFFRAITASHPANTVEAFKCVAKWIWSVMPAECFGSYEKVKSWSQLDPEARRKVLEEHKLIYTPEEETWLVISDTPTVTPLFI